MIKNWNNRFFSFRKTTASKISFKKGPLFSADNIVKKLYRKNKYRKKLLKKFDIKNTTNFKRIFKKIKYKKKKSLINKLEKISSPTS